MRRAAVSLILVVSLGACDGGAPPDGGPTVGGAVLLEDDFSDASVGWLGAGETSFQGENVDMEIVGGRLRIFVKTPEGRGGPDSTGLEVENAGALESLGDVRIEVDADRTTNPADHFYAVLCRMQDFDNFYGFAVVEGGIYSIFKLSGGVAQELTGGASDRISRGEVGTNRIGAECVGDRLTMSLDGERVAEARDGEFARGAVGLLAETRGQRGLEVFFDDLVIRAP